MEIKNHPYRIMKLKAVIECTGRSRASIYRDIKQDMFPKPVKLGRRSVGWLESEIAAWVQSRIEDSRA